MGRKIIFNRNQVFIIVAGVAFASVVGMASVAAAALVGMDSDTLTAASAVISTALSTVAIIAAFGMIETRDKAGSRASGRGDSHAERFDVRFTGCRLEVDTERGVARLATGDMTIALHFEPRNIVIDSSTDH